MPFQPSPPNVSIREYKKGGEPSPRAHYRVVPIAPAHFVSLPPHVNSWQIFTTQSFQPNSPYLTRELQRFRDYYNQQKCSTDQTRMWRRISLLFFFKEIWYFGMDALVYIYICEVCWKAMKKCVQLVSSFGEAFLTKWNISTRKEGIENRMKNSNLWRHFSLRVIKPRGEI